MIDDESRRRPPAPDGLGPTALLLLAVTALVVRLPFLGHPAIDVDEEFYLLVGDRLLHGALPYVDIWDRKPLGLFLLFSAIRLPGGDGILTYQLAAAGFVAATAVTIACLARRIAPPAAAWLAGLAYPPALALSGGAGGQTPVFYNLPTALAVLAVAGAVARSDGRHRFRRGLAAMLLVGVAMQLKYTAVFEGLYLGIVLLVLDGRGGARAAARLGHAAGWVAAALAPTLAAWAAYVALGHGDAFVYANFTSIHARGGVDPAEALDNLRECLGHVAPLLVPALIGALAPARAVPGDGGEQSGPIRAFLWGWLAAAVAGFLLFGSYFAHYALPLLPPLAVAAAPAFAIRTRRIGLALAAAVLGYLLFKVPVRAAKLAARRGDAAYTYALAARIRPMLAGGGCLYVFYGEPILDQLTGSCLPSRWPFPSHLSLAREAPALGVDPLREVARILAERPPVIVDRATQDTAINRPVRALLDRALRRDYRLVYAHPFANRDPDVDRVWQRLPGR